MGDNYGTDTDMDANMAPRKAAPSVGPTSILAEKGDGSDMANWGLCTLWNTMICLAVAEEKVAIYY